MNHNPRYTYMGIAGILFRLFFRFRPLISFNFTIRPCFCGKIPIFIARSV